MRLDQPVREQVQAQVGVRGVGRRRVEVDDDAHDLGTRRLGAGACRAARAASSGRLRPASAPSAGRREPGVEQPCRRRSYVARPCPEAARVALSPAATVPDVTEPIRTCSMPRPRPADVVALTAALVDIASVSGNEEALADAVEAALRGLPHLEVERDGNTVVARTALGRAERVVLAGHLDTVPRPTTCRPGSSDGRPLRAWLVRHEGRRRGPAPARRRRVPEPVRDVTYFFYEGEEVEAGATGCGGSSRPTRAAGRRLRRPDGAVRRARSRPAARARCGSRSTVPAGAPTAPGRGWAERDPRGRARAGPARGVRARGGRGRRAALPRGPQRGHVAGAWRAT